MSEDTTGTRGGEGDVASPAAGDILKATGVSVTFGGLRALTDVDIAAGHQQIVAVIGPNGAGKTTLLNAISGIVPMSGELFIEGRRPSAIQPRVLARLGLARSFQAPHLIESQHAVENVVGGAYLRAGYGSAAQVFRRWHVRLRERQLEEEARELLAQVGIQGREMGKPVAQLTHGTRKRVDIARALMSRPKVVLMDEPTSGMGTGERQIVTETMDWIRRDLGAAIIMVEHHMDVVRATADKAVALQAGAMLMTGAVDDVLQSDGFIVASIGQAAAESLHETKPDSSNDKAPGSAAARAAQQADGASNATRADKWRN
jgi:branched-chain amino acid transport system ATP-binding protein